MLGASGLAAAHVQAAPGDSVPFTLALAWDPAGTASMSVSRGRHAPSSSGNSSQVLLSLGALTGGLLSSSCCIIQLVLNYTSIGCAGFSALTPYRHVFRAITGVGRADSSTVQPRRTSAICQQQQQEAVCT